jgi:hypothetical protein
MTELIPGLPEHIVAASCRRGLSGEEFDRVLRPAMETALDIYERIDVVLVLDEQPGDPSSRALWDDGRLGMSDLRKFRRLALVSDLDWVRTLVSTFGFFAPCSLKRFGIDELDAALRWIQK